MNDCASSTTGNKSQCSLKHLEDEASLLSGNEIDTRLRGSVRQIKFTDSRTVSIVGLCLKWLLQGTIRAHNLHEYYETGSDYPQLQQ